MQIFNKLANEKSIFALLLLVFLLIVLIGGLSSKAPDVYVDSDATRSINLKCVQYVTPKGENGLQNAIKDLAAQCRKSYEAQGIRLGHYYEADVVSREPANKDGLRLVLTFKPEK